MIKITAARVDVFKSAGLAFPQNFMLPVRINVPSQVSAYLLKICAVFCHNRTYFLSNKYLCMGLTFTGV